jgi:GT2 family glycosyltransferase
MTRALLASVVIPTYQRRESLVRALISLGTQTIPPDQYEVIAAVDGSTDGTADATRALRTPYALSVLEGPNRGRAGACNAGIRAAGGQVVVLLDDDMEAVPQFLEAHLQAHEGSGTRAVVGAAPIVVRPDSPTFVRYMASGFAARLERLAAPGYRLHFRDTYTGNFSVSREVLLHVGGFDEAFRLYGHEDYELALRLQAAGVELVFSRDACARQHYEKTFAGFARDGIARGRTAVLFASKHPEDLDRLKISEYDRETLVWRTGRGWLLALSRFTGRIPEWIIALITLLERRPARRLERYYTMAIDYFYWHGVFAARREQHAGAGADLPAAPLHPLNRKCGDR